MAARESFRNAKKNAIEAEKKIASFLIYYDIEEIDSFMDDFIASIRKSDLSLSTNMEIFVQAVNAILAEEPEAFNDGSKGWNPEFLMDKVTYQAEIIESSERNKSAFRKWMKEVEGILSDHRSQDIFLLADACKDYFYWNAFLDKVVTIDNSTKSYSEKLQIRLPEIQDSNDSKIIKLSDIKETTFDKSIYTMGIDDLDVEINLQETNLVYIAARPSVGKSMFVLNMAIKNAFKGIPSLYLSFEMSDKQTLSRILTWVKDDEIEDAEEIEKLKQTETFQMIEEHFHMVKAESMNGDLVYSIIDKFFEQHPNGIAFIDSINLVRYTGLEEFASLRNASRDNKRIALKRKGIIVSCCLASRESENTGMTMSSLYGASMLEADADIIVGLEPSSRLGVETYSPLTAKILKNRDGRKDVDIPIKLKKSTMHFYDSSDGIN